MFQQAVAEKVRSPTRSGRDISSTSFSINNDVDEGKAEIALPQSLSFNFAQLPIHAVPIALQTKLTVNEPGDKYEQEADAMADKVMRMTDKEMLETKVSSTSNIHRKCAKCAEEKKDEENKLVQFISVHRKCAKCEEEESGLQRKESSSATPYVSSTVHQTLKSSGQPLDKATRSFMEPRFGFDFSKVRIHNDSLAHRSAKGINALAYTHGNNIVFAAGQYQPDTINGKKLLAHELTHTIQQQTSPLNSVLQRQKGRKSNDRVTFKIKVPTTVKTIKELTDFYGSNSIW